MAYLHYIPNVCIYITIITDCMGNETDPTDGLATWVIVVAVVVRIAIILLAICIFAIYKRSNKSKAKSFDRAG